MDQVVSKWNVHKISQKSKSNIFSTGRLEIMFAMPHLYNVESYLIPVTQFGIDPISSESTFYAFPGDQNFYCLFNKHIDE